MQSVRTDSSGASPARELSSLHPEDRSGGEGNEAVGASSVEGHLGDFRRLGERAGRNQEPSSEDLDERLALLPADELITIENNAEGKAGLATAIRHEKTP